MAFHNRLTRTQRILLAIFCFPLLPFYLCYICCCASGDEDEEDDPRSHDIKLDRMEKAAADTVDGHSNTAARNIQPKPRKSSLPKRLSSRRGKREAEESSANGNAEVVVEIHPEQNIRRSFTKFSFRKGKEKRSNDIVYENKGFVDDDNNTVLSQKTEYAYPWDKSSLKSMKIDLDKLKHIDNYASKVRPKNTVEALVQQLLKGANTDIEKLRAIWMWVTHHIAYDVEGLRNPGLRSSDPSHVLKTGMGVCGGYASLFQAMCSIAGIECKEVSGYSKGLGYKLGQHFSGDPDHAWNAVRLNGSWHLLDSTWGAGYTDQNCSKFTFKYNEFYFLTHPALFVGDHFPQDRKLQLLKPRLSLKQFEDAIHRKSSFYNMGLLSSQPETSLIQSDGKTTITVQTSSPVLFTYNLNGNKTSGIMTLRPNGMKLDVYPESTGLHSLEIYAKAPDAEEEETYSMVCEYQLQCRAVSREMKIPHNLINPVGPSWATEREGLQEPSQREPIVHTKDGRCSFRFRVPACLHLMAMLKTTAFSMADDEQRRHIFQSRQGSWVEFKVQVPQAAMYVFSVYGKDKAEAGSYGYICNYLISCTNPRVRWPLYPLTYATWKEDYELVEPLVGVLPANRSVQFKMRIPDVSQVSVEGRETRNLSLGSDGYWSGSCSTVGCRDLNVMIKVKPHDRSLSFILNYQVEIQ